MDYYLGSTLFFVGAVVVALWPFYKLFRRSRRLRETKALASIAQARDLMFVERDDRLLDEFCGAPLEKDTRKGWNFLSGSHRGREFVAFDLELITIHESRGFEWHRPHDRMVVAVQLPEVSPNFHVVPENAMRRGVMGALGIDIDLELEEFNRAFTVVGEDRRFVVHALSPATMLVLLEIPAQAWNCHGQWLACISLGRLLPQLEYVEATVDRVADVIDAIPSFAWEQDPG